MHSRHTLHYTTHTQHKTLHTLTHNTTLHAHNTHFTAHTRNTAHTLHNTQSTTYYTTHNTQHRTLHNILHRTTLCTTHTHNTLARTCSYASLSLRWISSSPIQIWHRPGAASLLWFPSASSPSDLRHLVLGAFWVGSRDRLPRQFDPIALVAFMELFPLLRPSIASAARLLLWFSSTFHLLHFSCYRFVPKLIGGPMVILLVGFGGFGW